MLLYIPPATPIAVVERIKNMIAILSANKLVLLFFNAPQIPSKITDIKTPIVITAANIVLIFVFFFIHFISPC